MLVRILKLFGLDLPAKIAEVRIGIEERLELAKDQASQTVQTVAVVTALSAVAAITLLSAFAVGLIALYHWVAIGYGPFFGLAAVGTVLIFVAIAALSGAMIKAKSLPAGRSTRAAAKKPEHARAHAERVSASAATIEQRLSIAPPVQPLSSTSASDLIEPLSLVLSRMIRFPSVGNPVLDDLLVRLRESARGVADDAVQTVAHAVRDGNRPHMLAVLGGAVLLGWVLGRHHSPEADALQPDARV
jgi:ABC-type protease/lipase transport system fused ATPase/permease subunit